MPGADVDAGNVQERRDHASDDGKGIVDHERGPRLRHVAPDFLGVFRGERDVPGRYGNRFVIRLFQRVSGEEIEENAACALDMRLELDVGEHMDRNPGSG